MRTFVVLSINSVSLVNIRLSRCPVCSEVAILRALLSLLIIQVFSLFFFVVGLAVDLLLLSKE